MFSSAVFEENPRYCNSLGIVVIQKLWHFVISLITEAIYLKLGICAHFPKSNPYYQGKLFKMHFFFNYAPFSTRLCILYQASHS